jgi:citrate lyase subunit beta/citryl-CoA lyase
VTDNSIAPARSLLFAPGSEPRKLVRALDSEADIVVADLEDAVVAEEKEHARHVVAEVFRGRGGGPARAVRINGADSEHFAADLEALAGIDVDAVVLPKAVPEAVAALGREGPPVIALVETAQGVRLAYETAAAPRVAALGLGAADLGAQLWLEPQPDGEEILYARSKLVVDSAAAEIRAPLDVVHLDVSDDEGLEAEARRARALGFRGKFCIHPRQLPVVNRVFAPSAEEVSWATDVIDAYGAAEREGRGAILVRGALVDTALVRRAERILGGAHGR